MIVRLINEGGNAVPGVSRINQENVEKTLNSVYSKLLPLLGLNTSDTALLGSTGKKLPGGSSGDMDLAISKSKLMHDHGLDEKQLIPFIVSKVKKLGIDFKPMPGLGIVSVAWPIENIDGKQDGKTVQLDLMLSDNVNMTKWGMYSAHEKEQPYKGAVRNLILYWIANVVDYKALKREADKDTEFEKDVFDTQRGLFRLKQSYYDKNGKLSSKKKTIFRKLISDDPDAIVKILLGDNYKSSDILTVSDAWDALMSPDFPYKDYRKTIVKNIVNDLQKHGFDYPDYIDKYIDNKSMVTEAYSMLLEAKSTEYDTPRVGMIKIHQMNPQQFVNFINALKGLIKDKSNTKINLADLNVQEKVDGTGVRIIVNNGAIGLESSYSGVVYNADEFPLEQFRETLKYLQNVLGDKLIDIAAKNKTSYKVIGELFYINDVNSIDADSTVTFIGTKYDSKKLGSFGSVIIFNADGIQDNKLVQLTPEQRKGIINDLKDLTTDQFKFFSDDDIKWKGEFDIQIQYDTKLGKKILNNPELLLDKSNKEFFESFRDAIAQAFSREISKKGSLFGVPETEVEGIVFDINGQKFGATNFNWKEKKAAIYKSEEEFNQVISNFYKTVFGFVKPKKIQQLLNTPDYKKLYGIPYKKEVAQFKQDLKAAKYKFDHDKLIPAAIKKMQKFFVEETWQKLKGINTNIDSLKKALQ